ncbi:MAG: phosphoribosylglycinamide formyltransferase [Methylobacterium sp.]|nr:phosphoribosylglycinamide formyltransferase [Methylobacterium sp.]MCA3600014.1 phosphoribosylglycinamide formyltransferase [Methylobacterium sp.]MCA3607552.1 phosphoribosylglycinamide formyltransferase [Methylobacterium sp.]MCA3609484.1 phosphoribosylglycinamide formyltransferase [Methylobacterium sp.]MCA3611727.1 phosphoribosylglycinamide formyltransferase [Methylobacterium sp.]
MAKKRVAILISGRGSNMAALVRAVKADPAFPARIVLVLSNRPEAAGLALAAAEGIPTAIVPSNDYGKDRAAFDAAMQAELVKARAEIICLAGFMRLLTPEFCESWSGRMINIHPALLPSFKGLDTHARALAEGVKLHGCTTHFVTPGMDEGPIILQAAVPVLDDDTEESLAARVLAEEHRIYPETLRLLASGHLQVEGRRVRITPAG